MPFSYDPKTVPNQPGVYEHYDGATGACLNVGGSMKMNDRTRVWKRMLRRAHKRRAPADVQQLFDDGVDIRVRVLEILPVGVSPDELTRREQHWKDVRRPTCGKLGAEAGAAMRTDAARDRSRQTAKQIRSSAGKEAT